jgi:hypothetical protein
MLREDVDQLKRAHREEMSRAHRSPAGGPPLSSSPRLPPDLTVDRLQKFVVRVVQAALPSVATTEFTPAQLQAALEEIRKLRTSNTSPRRAINSSEAEEQVQLFRTLFGLGAITNVASAMQSVYAELQAWKDCGNIIERAMGLKERSRPEDLAHAVLLRIEER